MVRQTIVSSAVVSMVTTVIFCSGCKRAETTAPPSPPLTVEVVTVQQQDVPVYGESVGTLEADVNASISAQVSGYLLSRNYVEGSVVTNGQILFQIDDRTYKAALDQAEAKVIKTAQDVKRYTPLARTQAISQQELDDAIQANAAAEAAAEQARLNYQFCTIRSPVDGVAGLAQAQVGDLVGPGSGPLTSVAKMQPIRVYFSISQQLMSKLLEERLARGKGDLNSTNGAPLELTLASGSVYPLKGRVRFADNQVDVKTGTIRVVGEFDNPDRLLVPGMFVRVRAQIGVNKDALLVPQKAVIDFQGRNFIAVVGADRKVSLRPVVVGQQVGELCVVTGNLKAGEQVVADGIQKVRDGMEVNPEPLNASAIPAEMAGN
ncbi:MAG TPA: efflux RND transporter periplasmic adaptor subunit [Verrucomicrobiae bacterium]|nr:efflux RND transporter periplasmic adaptor subunit [Verrucomicrobiae bacterium]